MEIVYDESDLLRYMQSAVTVSDDSPVLLDRYLSDAIEVDVDCVCDGKEVFIGGIMQHIEQAGVHSGDSACSIPPYTLSQSIQDRLKEQVKQLALAIGTVGLMNTQFAIRGEEIFILEVNPRASRTIPFVAKTIGVPLAKVGARCMVGKSLAEQGVVNEVTPKYFSVKESVFPFNKFTGVDPILGPEMKSTGEVMGVGETFAEAFAKSQLGAGVSLPKSGKVFISVRDEDKPKVIDIARQLIEKGYSICATRGTVRVLAEAGLQAEHINKVKEGRPHIVDMMKNGEIVMIINTSEGKKAVLDSFHIRREALNRKICYTTTISGAIATLMALDYLENPSVICLQDMHKEANS
jgi:carbamoyl-phosphate synthase large subunit